MHVLYRTDSEYKQHSDAIHLIADQYHINESQVREVYEKVLDDLLKTAKFRKYLLILATRHVKQLLCKTEMTG